MRKAPVVTIDGPSGAGKSTVARALAESLGFIYVDTGAMYRGVAYAFLRRPPGASLEEFLGGLSLVFEFAGATRVLLNGTDISEAIRDPEISRLASDLSKDRRVRSYLTERQREFGRNGGAVIEGRDTGSVVFPDAEVKVYLDAGIEERAKRRYKELSRRGAWQDLSRVREEMAERDANDSTRDVAPLVVPEGATVVDTTGMDIPSVVRALVSLVGGGRP